MSFEREDLLKTELPPSPSSTESKTRLKSPPRINILFSKYSKIQDLKYYNVEKQIVWKSTVYTSCFLESWSHDQSVCTNISHSKTRFIAESSHNM